MSRSGFGAAIAGVVLVLALAGCAPAIHTADPTVPPAPGGTPTATATTPTPTPTATQAVPAGLTIGPDGIGPLVPGAAVPTGGAGVVRRDPAGCNTDDTWGAWTAVDPAFKFVVATTGGHQYAPIYSLGVFDRSVPTITGIHAGDTASQLLAAYPHFDATVPNDDTRLYVINGVHGHLIFEVGLTDAHSASELNPGEAGKVISIRSEPLADRVESIANTDGYSNCHG